MASTEEEHQGTSNEVPEDVVAEVEVEAEETNVVEEDEEEAPKPQKTREEERGAVIDREVRVTGTVTRYMTRQGFGFISLGDVSSKEEATEEEANDEEKANEDEDRLFFHWKAIVSDQRWPKVSEGTLVEFYVGTQQDGRKFAAHVTAPGGEQLNGDKRDWGDKPRHSGSVKFFDKKKGFGFVEVKDEIEEYELKVGDEIFVGREEICSNDNPPVLSNGMDVEFYALKTDKGIHCAEVTGANGEKINIKKQEMKKMQDPNKPVTREDNNREDNRQDNRRKGGNRRGRQPRNNYNNNRGNYYNNNNRNRYNNNQQSAPFYPPWNYPNLQQLRYRGTITQINKEKGYGWITPDRQILGSRFWKGSGGRQRIYFHSGDLDGSLKIEDLEGQEVSFITYVDRKGAGAASIQIIDETAEEKNEIQPKQTETQQSVAEEEDAENSTIPNAPSPPQVPPVMHPYDTVTSLITLQVQNIFIGGLIGKQGKSIRELNRVSGCMIQVLDVEDDEPLTPHSCRVVSISGYSTNIKKACKLITNKLSEISKNALGRIEFLFDADLTGRIIGKRGANVTRLRQKTHPDSPLYVTVSKEGLEFRGKQMNSLEIFGPILDVQKTLDRAVDLLVDLQHQSFQEEFTQQAESYNPYANYGYNGGGNMDYMSQFAQQQQPQYNQKPTQPMNYYNVTSHGHHNQGQGFV